MKVAFVRISSGGGTFAVRNFISFLTIMSCADRRPFGAWQKCWRISYQSSTSTTSSQGREINNRCPTILEISLKYCQAPRCTLPYSQPFNVPLSFPLPTRQPRHEIIAPTYGKSIMHTTLEEKQAATRVSSLFHATSKMSPFPLKLLMCLPCITFQM